VTERGNPASASSHKDNFFCIILSRELNRAAVGAASLYFFFWASQSMSDSDLCAEEILLIVHTCGTVHYGELLDNHCR
jgi:hypothetical protein